MIDYLEKKKKHCIDVLHKEIYTSGENFEPKHNDIIEKYRFVESLIGNPICPTLYAYIYSIPKREITKFWGFENLHLNRQRKVTKEHLDSLVIEEQRLLIKSDALSITYEMNEMLVEGFVYTSSRAHLVNHRVHQVMFYGMPFEIVEGITLSYLVIVNDLGQYNGEPFTSSVNYKLDPKVATNAHRVLLSTIFKEEKNKLFRALPLDVIEQDIVIKISLGIPRAKIIKSILEDHDINIDLTKIDNTRKKVVKLFRKKFPLCSDFIHSDNLVFHYLNKMYSLSPAESMGMAF